MNDSLFPDLFGLGPEPSRPAAPARPDADEPAADSAPRRKRLTEDDILDMCLVIIPSGVVGARLYYVIFEWASYASNPIRALYIWEGGLAIYGAVIGGLLGMFIYSKVRKKLTTAR